MADQLIGTAGHATGVQPSYIRAVRQEYCIAVAHLAACCKFDPAIIPIQDLAAGWRSTPYRRRRYTYARGGPAVSGLCRGSYYLPMLPSSELLPSVRPCGPKASNTGQGRADRLSGGSGADVHIRSQGKSGCSRVIAFNIRRADALNLADLLEEDSDPTALETDNGNPGIAAGTDTNITVFDVAANR